MPCNDAVDDCASGAAEASTIAETPEVSQAAAAAEPDEVAQPEAVAAEQQTKEQVAEQPTDDAVAQGSFFAYAVSDFDTDGPNMLHVKAGDLIAVLQRHESGWCFGERKATGATGWCPDWLVPPCDVAATSAPGPEHATPQASEASSGGGAAVEVSKRRTYGGTLRGSMFIKRGTHDIESFTEEERRACLEDMEAERSKRLEEMKKKNEERQIWKEKREAKKAKEFERQQAQREAEMQEEEENRKKRAAEMKEWLLQKKKSAAEQKRRENAAIAQLLDQEKHKKEELDRLEQERKEQSERRRRVAERKKEIQMQHFMRNMQPAEAQAEFFAEAAAEQQWCQAQAQNLEDAYMYGMPVNTIFPPVGFCVQTLPDAHAMFDFDEITSAFDEVQKQRLSRPESAAGLGGKEWRPAGCLRPKSAKDIRMQRQDSGNAVNKQLRRAQSAGRLQGSNMLSPEVVSGQFAQPVVAARLPRPPSAPTITMGRRPTTAQPKTKQRPISAPAARMNSQSTGYAKTMEKAWGTYLSAQPGRPVR